MTKDAYTMLETRVLKPLHSQKMLKEVLSTIAAGIQQHPILSAMPVDQTLTAYRLWKSCDAFFRKKAI